MIWCVEDDASIRDIEIYTLQSTGFHARGFADGGEFFGALGSGTDDKPELILLDVMLPDMDGVEILRRLKASPDTRSIPVIMATAKGAEYDKVHSLDLGADDYLVKPFGMMEMVSRIKAVLRRCTPQTVTTLRNGGIELCPERRTVTADGEKITLTYKEYELLKLFLSNIGMAFSRDRLLDIVWDTEYGGETRTVDAHIKSLRKKLGASGALIETVRGVGYRMEAQS